MFLVGIPAQAQPSSDTVKITPLGQRTGDLCARDRALIFEDPTGVRILYDPGVYRKRPPSRTIVAISLVGPVSPLR